MMLGCVYCKYHFMQPSEMGQVYAHRCNTGRPNLGLSLGMSYPGVTLT